ncbi:MAG: hypothetical protein HDS24_01125 [Bacteroides sp.]|nr:hypothetical protein [Bacteroidales bacterium]MBD5290666.1 hypothetical protein [Bacteroides sp.]
MKYHEPSPQSTSRRSPETERRLRAAENCATFGLLLVCVGLVSPFFSQSIGWVMDVSKWVYTAGALIYLGARIAGVVADRGASMRVRRLRRMEGWAGVCFCVGAFFWLFNFYRFGSLGFGLKVIGETVTFTLAGAVIQIIASWLLASALRKEINP